MDCWWRDEWRLGEKRMFLTVAYDEEKVVGQ